jgi:hypothetical protein
MEALVKSLVVFLSGFTTTAAGAFIRSCSDRFPAEFANAWCGASPPPLMEFNHAHCAGCAMMTAGIGLIAIAPMLVRLRQPAVQTKRL